MTPPRQPPRTRPSDQRRKVVAAAERPHPEAAEELIDRSPTECWVVMGVAQTHPLTAGPRWLVRAFRSEEEACRYADEMEREQKRLDPHGPIIYAVRQCAFGPVLP